MFAFVWQIWTWEPGTFLIWLFLGILLSLLLAIVFVIVTPGTMLDSIINNGPLLMFFLGGLLVLSFGASWLIFGSYEVYREAAREDIVRTFEDKGLNVAAVSSDHMTIELRSECDEVWEYELYGDHSDGSLGINPNTETLVAGSSDESQVFGPACPSPYQEWSSSIADE